MRIRRRLLLEKRATQDPVRQVLTGRILPFSHRFGVNPTRDRPRNRRFGNIAGVIAGYFCTG